MFLFQAAKERGRAGRGEGIHYYSYKLSFSLVGLKVSTFSNDCKFCAATFIILELPMLFYFQWNLTNVAGGGGWGKGD